MNNTHLAPTCSHKTRSTGMDGIVDIACMLFTKVQMCRKVQTLRFLAAGSLAPFSLTLSTSLDSRGSDARSSRQTSYGADETPILF